MRTRVVRGLLLLALTVAALLFVLGFHGFGSKAARLGDLMTDGAQYAAITDGRTEDEGLLSALLCDDVTLPRAGSDFYFSLPGGDPRALDPVVEALGSEKLSIVFPQTTIDEAFLRTGEPIPFTVYTADRFARGSLYLTTLPVMNVTVTEPDAEGSFAVYDRNARDAEMTLIDNRENLRLVHSETTIRVRGASSSFTPKQSYRLSLFSASVGGNIRKNKLSLLGMRQDEDWVLYAGGSDLERIRNGFSYNLWNESCASANGLHKNLGIDCKYVELLLNGEYMGLYTLMYPLDEKQVGLPDDGFYYRGISYDDTTAEMLAQADTEDTVGGWEIRSGTGRDRWACLSDYLTHTNGYSGTAEDYLAWFGEKMDEENILNLHLFLSVVQGEDNYYKNNNVIAYPQGGGNYKYLLAPWDLDLTWGNRYSSEGEWHVVSYENDPEKEFHAWALPADRNLKLDPEFGKKLLARWQELRAGAWSDEALTARIDSYEADIYGSGAMARERGRWPTSPTSENLDRFRAYCETRMAFLDGYFEEVGK